MSDMIERATQAILAKEREGIINEFHARVFAIAVIKAMREPTESMAEKGTLAVYDKRQTGFLCCNVYRAMIDAALEER